MYIIVNRMLYIFSNKRTEKRHKNARDDTKSCKFYVSFPNNRFLINTHRESK